MFTPCVGPWGTRSQKWLPRTPPSRGPRVSKGSRVPCSGRTRESAFYPAGSSGHSGDFRSLVGDLRVHCPWWTRTSLPVTLNSFLPAPPARPAPSASASHEATSHTPHGRVLACCVPVDIPVLVPGGSACFHVRLPSPLSPRLGSPQSNRRVQGD